MLSRDSQPASRNMEAEISSNDSGLQSTPIPALGGRACTNCARVKCKCIYRADGATCERCYRLKKECTPSTSVGRRTAKRRGISRTARLEEKLDELVSALKTQRGTKKDPEDDYEDLGEQGELDSDTDTPSVAALTPATATNSLGGTTLLSASKTPDSNISYSDEPPPPEAEELLKKFREETIGFFPFVYIPPHVTSQQLRELYPFLWLNIVCVALGSPRRRTALGDQARNIVIQKIVIDREKSLDLLLGLLALVGWAHLQRRDRPFWTLFSQLIVTLVCDLGLHQPPSNGTLFCAPSKDGDPRMTNYYRRRTHEEQRAVLGAFVVTSMVSNIFKHAPGLRWSSHLDGYLSNLAQDSTVTQDETLIAQVRMQLIINQMYDDSWQTSGGGGPPALYLSALRSQLHEITRQEKLGTAVRNHPMILELYHFTELLINESAISKSTTPWNEPDLRRFEVYQNCLVSIKAFIDTFFATPITLLGSMPLTSFPQLVRVVRCLHKISTIQDPAWDRAAVRRTIDLIPTCDKIIGTFEYLKAASALVTPDGGEDESHNWGIGVFRKMRAAWQNEMANLDAVNSASRETSMVDATQGSGFAAAMDFSGDPWLTDVMNEFWE
ncbi:hypothetical protein GGR54DRAFT_600933 [Hypoxylon sp. NC1633]|nr:hypothetical protein GGR54DRAFT_600933 [Hypoxylon sp. NC1633]